MNNKSKNEQSINQDLVAKHVFSKNGTVFIKKCDNLKTSEWSAINFYWKPVLELNKELGY